MADDSMRDNYIKGTVAWYPFQKESKVLTIGGMISDFSVISDYLCEKGMDVDSVCVSETESVNGVYDYILSLVALESCDDIKNALVKLAGCLKPNGKLLLLADNRLGIQYFAGDKDLFSKQVFDGIENYTRHNIRKLPGRSYNKSEWISMLSEAGFKTKVYGVFPSLFEANIFVADGYRINENLSDRFEALYNNSDTVFMDTRYLYDELRDNGMLISMANGFFVECSFEDNLCAYDQITVQSNRDEKSALATYINGDVVYKKPLWGSDFSHINTILENYDYLRLHNVKMAESNFNENALATKFEKGKIATEYFRELICKNTDEFFEQFDAFAKILTESSDHVAYDNVDWDRFDPCWDLGKSDDPRKGYWKKLAYGDEKSKEYIGPVLERGYIDLTTINCVKTENDFVFFDQEFFVKSFPVKALIYRAIMLIYQNHSELYNYLPMDEVLERYDLRTDANAWREFTERPLADILNSKNVAEYDRNNRVSKDVLNANRMRMNYSQSDYEKYFTDILRDVPGRKCYIFGAGKYAEEFINSYSQYLDISGVIDNDKNRWGQRLGAFEIMPPSVLDSFDLNCKVFICIKRYESVFAQLKECGIKNIAIFNPDITYAVPKRNIANSKIDEASGEGQKKYNVGYVAGVFDLFHIGHINLLRRAKEQCKHLIVGVVTDEQVISNKRTTPYYSFEDRLEIVRSCKYVDEAYAIPFGKNTTRDAYQLYGFDVQFSGSDYENDPHWLGEREYLRKHGSDLVFFPYTESVSTTKIKEEIRDK